MNTLPRSRLAVLGTLSELHRQPIAYDLMCLRRLITDAAPDILCAEITREAWEAGDLSQASVEVREALAPIETATDIVLVPVATSPRQFSDFNPGSGWRRNLVGMFDRLLKWGQRRANRPEAIHSLTFGVFCHTLCWLIERTWTAKDRLAWEAQNQAISDNVLQVVLRDPGRRILVAVQCQRLHRIIPLLHKQSAALEIVDYRQL